MKIISLFVSIQALLLLFSNLFALEIREEKDDKEKRFQVKLEVITKSSLGSFKESIDISSEHTGASVSLYGYHIDDYIRSFGGTVGCTDFVATISV